MGQQRKLWIPGPAGRIEAALRTACPARAAAVLAHPHPLHGGTLHNPVIFHADRELNRAGLVTLRFNFRGVGESEGRHDDGRGEVLDVEAAVAFLRGVAGEARLILVGYSFGSLCALAHAVNDPAVAGVIAIGLPCRVRPLPEIGRLHRPLAVVQASQDEFGTPAEVREHLARAGPPATLHVVEGTTHLFPGRADEAAHGVVAAADAVLGEAEPGSR